MVFSETVAAFTKETPSVSVTGGAISAAQGHTEDGLEHAHIFLDPNGNGDLTFTLVANEPCDAGGICTAAGTRLSEVPRARTIPGPGDTDAPPLSELSVNDVTAAEGDGALAFIVRLDPATTETVTVETNATADGSARAGADYTATSGTLRFAPGQTSKTVSVAIDDDVIEETDETLTLTLSNTPRAEIKDTTATGTIEDDDEETEEPVETVTTPPTASISGGSGKEGDDASIRFTVTLDETASAPVTMDYATSEEPRPRASTTRRRAARSASAPGPPRRPSPSRSPTIRRTRATRPSPSRCRTRQGPTWAPARLPGRSGIGGW